MYRDPKQWAYIRRLVLEKGGSRKGVSRKTGLSRNTVRKMLACPQPPSKSTPPNGTEEKLLESARSLAAQRTLSSQSHIDAAHCFCGVARVTSS
jgi:hypothetical protein